SDRSSRERAFRAARRACSTLSVCSALGIASASTLQRDRLDGHGALVERNVGLQAAHSAEGDRRPSAQRRRPMPSAYPGNALPCCVASQGSTASIARRPSETTWALARPETFRSTGERPATEETR